MSKSQHKLKTINTDLQIPQTLELPECKMLIYEMLNNTKVISGRTCVK